ncbi:MAG: GNAT family N-acetyltransferase, partial [Deltaproteobacteria bacterium]|nr:GNAT family N-acetyltransferase [Deltaproteobacteria bacterium]
KAVLARVAVLKEFRGFGIASKIVKASLLKAENLNIRKIDISPHEHLKGFYESLGFKYIEKSEVVANHQLIKMEKTLRP